MYIIFRRSIRSDILNLLHLCKFYAYFLLISLCLMSENLKLETSYIYLWIISYISLDSTDFYYSILRLHAKLLHYRRTFGDVNVIRGITVE